MRDVSLIFAVLGILAIWTGFSDSRNRSTGRPGLVRVTAGIVIVFVSGFTFNINTNERVVQFDSVRSPLKDGRTYIPIGQTVAQDGAVLAFIEEAASQRRGEVVCASFTLPPPAMFTYIDGRVRPLSPW